MLCFTLWNINYNKNNMKKIYQLAALALMALPVLGQTPFFQTTTYRGAFAPAPTPMWTDGWTEWDPQNKVYPTANKVVNNNITTNTTWSTSDVILLSGQIVVKNNAVLTIEPGCVILGDKSIGGSALIITKGSQIIANGTLSQPIVFTSNQAPGSRSLGDWGGLIILGKGPNNNPGGINNIEGLPITTDSEYGGGASPAAADNSGSLKYVRIEYGGYIYSPGKEINGLTFGAVGRSTTVDFVQVSFVNDDGFEWFGGTVNCKHLVSYRNLDDDFDTDNGFNGNVQFCLAVKDPNIADNPTAPVGASTSEGFESDNDPSGTTATPITSAIFSNVTIVGPLRGVIGSGVAVGHRRGARLRRNTQLKITNTIFMDMATRGLHIDGSACDANATAGSITFKNNIIAGYGQRAGEITGASTLTINSWMMTSGFGNDTLTSSANILVTPYNYTSPDYRPLSSGIANSGASFTDAIFTGLIDPTAGVKELVNNNISDVLLYPNPATTSCLLTLSLAKEEKLSIKIYDVVGSNISVIADNAFNKGQNNVEINTSNLSSGIYFIEISGEVSTFSKKLIVNK